MPDISADKVKELREKSGAGIMDCKRALSAASGDLEKAIDFLRKEGVLKAAKKAGRATLEGLVGIALSPDRRYVSLVEVNCETDFVARTDQFQEFVSSIAELIVQQRPKDSNDLQTRKLGGVTVEETLSQLVARIGENMAVRRFRVIGCDSGDQIGSYIHAGSKIGALVRLKGGNESLAREVAMHVAAMTPHYVDRKAVPAAVIEREKEIARAAPEMAGKPENLLDRIIEGKVNRYLGEVCLADQPFIKDPTGKKTVGGYLKEKAPGVEIIEMVRFQVGEET